jgi:hypothetical protein
MSPKQRQILDWVKRHGTITTTEATALVGEDIYANQAKHVGAILGRMVKRGLLLRVARAVYSKPPELNALAVAVFPTGDPDKVWLQHAAGDGGVFDRREVTRRLDSPRELQSYFLRNL